jgi:hypothetical protein
VSQVLVLLACCTSFDVFCDPCLGAGPEVFPIDVSDHFISPGVAVDRAFVPHIHEFAFQPLIQGYDKSLAFDISLERLIQVIYAFDWVKICPFFH